MCDVCCAEIVISKKGGVKFSWGDDSPDDAMIHVEAKGKGGECAPCKVRIRRKGEKWSRWFRTNDLAGVMGRLGTDVKWPYVSHATRLYLLGKLSSEDIVGSLVVSQAIDEAEYKDKNLAARMSRARVKKK